MPSLKPPEAPSKERAVPVVTKSGKLVCLICGYGHFIRDLVNNGSQMVVCAQCATRWELEALKRTAQPGF